MKQFAILFVLCSISTTFAEKLSCGWGESLVTFASNVNCEDDDSCSGCKPLTTYTTKAMKCSKRRSCFQMAANIHARDDFFLECSDAVSCARNAYDCSPVIHIDCNSRKIEGIKCSGRQSCHNTRFVIDGGDMGCDVKLIECAETFSCYRASFEFIGNVNVEEFKCGDNACKKLHCEGSDQCPSSHPAACSDTTMKPTELPTTEPTMEPTSIINNWIEYVEEEFSGFAAAGNDHVADGNDLSYNDQGQVEVVTVSLSDATIANLWGIALLCLAAIVVSGACCYCRNKEEEEGRAEDEALPL